MARKNKSVNNEEIIQLETSTERHPTMDFGSNLSITEKTKKQIEILIIDGDITITPDGNFRISVSKMEYSISDKLYATLKKIFNWYAELPFDHFKKLIDIRLGQFKTEIPNKIEYLRKKLIDEINILDALIEREQFSFTREDIENSNWHDLMVDDKPLFDLIKYIKFDFFAGGEIAKDFPGDADFYLFESFFLSENLKLAYEVTRLLMRIRYLTDSLNELNEKPTHRTWAIVHKYKQDAGYEKELSRISIFKTWGKNREKGFDSIAYFNYKKDGKTYRKITESDLEKAIVFLAEYPKAKKAAENDLENLRNS